MLFNQINMGAPTSKSQATFLDLPAEIRNKIYRLQFIRGTFCIYTCAGRPWSTVLDLFCASHLPLNFIKACRQINSEGTSILYGENVFTFPDSIRCTMDFHLWLELTGPDNCKVLRSIDISPPLPRFPSKIFASFVNCSRMLENATDLNLPLVGVEIKSGSVANRVLPEGDKYKKIIVRRVGNSLELAWAELDPLQKAVGHEWGTYLK